MKLEKVVRVGTVPVWENRQASLFAKIEFTEDGRLSISGVVGPGRGGDCDGSAGQVIMSFKEYDKRGHAILTDISPAPGWDADTVRRFFDVWDRWHLNDMKAGCEHQRGTDTQRQVEVVSYKLTSEAYRLREDTRKAAADAALRGEEFTPTPQARALAELENWYSDVYAPPDADSPLSGCYEVSKREQKAIGWVKPEEHPEGMLSRPCEVCGYKYGSAWLREEVPADVVEFLRGLPDADVTPAWV